MVLPHRSLIEKHRAFIEKLSTTGTDQNFKDQAKAIIDLLKGRSLETLADDIDLQQDEIYNLDTRVTTNENNINQVTEEVGRHSEQVTEIRYDVDQQGNRINELGEVVDEIDQKTLSHAPYWSRDVCKLLNPKTEADWRLLSSRLGYSNDDIRSWSQQADPCMAMLNEWYATHKTSEATFGVFTALQEINRLDAAVVVENAMKAAVQRQVPNAGKHSEATGSRNDDTKTQQTVDVEEKLKQMQVTVDSCVRREELESKLDHLENNILPSYAQDINSRLDGLVTRETLQSIISDIQSSTFQVFADQLTSLKQEFQVLKAENAQLKQELSHLKSQQFV